jgi:predicted  nucleic acid-binding Zn-ribbon protein
MVLNILVEMAGLEEELADARATQAHHAARDLHLRQLQEEYEADAAEVEDASRQAATTLRGAEHRIQDIEAALAHKRDQVIGITDRRQYQALQKEIRSLEMELDRLETRAIELMEDVGRKDGQIRQADREREVQAERGAAELARMDQETVQARAAEEEILAQIARLMSMLPDSIARHLVRLRTQHSRSVVRVQDGACGGCFSRLPTQQGIDAAKGHALVRCNSCSRYVVRKSWK